MLKGIQSTALRLMSALVIAVAMPMAAQAGSLTIHNENCGESGNLNSSVTCKKDWASVCQCAKD